MALLAPALKSRFEGATPRADDVERHVRLANGAERVETYSLAGRLRRIAEPDGSSLRILYDADGHIREVAHSSQQNAAYTRSADGHEIASSIGRCRTVIELGDAGLPTRLTQNMDGHEWVVQYRHDAQGRVTGILYPECESWTTFRTSSRQPGSRTTRIECGTQELVEACFDSISKTTEIHCANNTVIGEDLSGSKGSGLQCMWHREASGAAFETSYSYYEDGRMAQAGAQRFSYDGAGRLAGCQGELSSIDYRYDGEGHLSSCSDGSSQTTFNYGSGPLVLGIERDLDDSSEYRYDALGRRVVKITCHEEIRYTYNLFGQLASVKLPSGEEIQYHYDGFGRLVARETSSDICYYVVGFDGQRLAEIDATGHVTRRYVWLGQNCIGMVAKDGMTTLHRVHGGRLAFIGDAQGRLSSVPQGSPYGFGSRIDESTPGLASMFGDSQTGLLLASSRWFDPEIAQFLTADSWFGTDTWKHLPRGMRQTLDSLPGGTDFSNSPAAAYNWCGFDPINRTDPNGHNPLGLIWSVISAFFWQMQVTSVALQMEVINIVLNILLLPFSFAYWDFYKKISIFNAIPPLLGSSRLMVPFAFPLNGIFQGDRAYTMGAVIWVRGNQLSNLEETSARDLLICSNAQEYLASTAAAATDTFRVRNPDAQGTATVNAAGTVLSTIVMAASAGGATVAQTFAAGDWLAIRLPGGEDEFRQVGSVAGADINLSGSDPALPASLQSKNVEVQRLDSAIMRIEKDASNICRTVTFVRGTAIHYAKQIPNTFPTSGLNVSEYLPAVIQNKTSGTSPTEALLVRLADAAHQADFAVNDFVRLRAGSSFFGRMVTALRAATDLVLDSPLPAPAPPLSYDPVEIMKLSADAIANNQSATGDRIDCGTLTVLRKQDGLAITAGGTTDRRIVLQLFVKATIPALPAGLQGIDLSVQTLVPGPQSNGKVASPTSINVPPFHAPAFENGQAIRVSASGTDFLVVITSVAADLITVADNLPAAFTAGTAVTITQMFGFSTADADPSPAPGDTLVITAGDPATPAQNDILLVLQRGTKTNGAIRVISAATTVVAQVDSNPSNNAGLTVQRFVPVAATLHGDAKVPSVLLRITFTVTSPFVVGDEVHVSGGEEGYGKVAAVNGMVIVLADPIDIPGMSSTVSVRRIKPTTHTTADAKLDESLIMIPSDLDEPLVNRRRAVELHEMRHVWQYAVLGPFFFSMPIPWLFNLGFSISSDGAGNAAHTLTKWLSLGILDKFFAVVAWGVGALFGAAPSSGNGNGKVGADSKSITFDSTTPDTALDAFTEGSPVEVAPATGRSIFNIIDTLDKPNKQIHLRFALAGDGFAPDSQVSAAVSAFDKINSTINKYFSLNLERLWSDHIPSAWGRALSGILNRENWLPGLGFYLLSLMAAGGDQGLVNFEQDASFESGDIYTPFTISGPNEIFVGQFSRVHAFVNGRGSDAAGNDADAGLSTLGDIVDALTVEPPTVAGKLPQDLVAGSLPSRISATQVHFRENWMIPLNDNAANVLGAFFAASAPGSYRLHTPGEVDHVQRMLFFSADFVELRNITVKALSVAPAFSSADPIFETEQATFVIVGDPAAPGYQIRYKAAPPAPVPAGTISGLIFTAPVLPGAAAVTHNLEIFVTYPVNAAIFQGKGQVGPTRLTTDAQRTNVCQDLIFDVAPIVTPVIPDVPAGSQATFTMPIAPASIDVTSPIPAGAASNASVQNGTGRPATLTFIAPDHVNANVTVTFNLNFGSGANVKTVPASVNVTPA